MKTIVFVSSNARKLQEARAACEPAGITVAQKDFTGDEIQSTDPVKIAVHKAQTAYGMLKVPVVVTDTSWSIPALKGFPGGYMKDIAHWFTEDNFFALMKDKSDRRVIFSENIVYYDGIITKHFSKSFEGVFTHGARGTGLSIENVAEFDGVTLGEHRERGTVSHAVEEYPWSDFVQWFLSQEV